MLYSVWTKSDKPEFRDELTKAEKVTVIVASRLPKEQAESLVDRLKMVYGDEDAHIERA